MDPHACSTSGNGPWRAFLLIVPRILFRTHYQADEPAYLELVVQRCTFPVRSSYQEVVADRLVRLLRPRKRLNQAAASYAVGLARAAGMLAPNLAWSPLGVVTALVSDISDYDEQAVSQLSVARRLLLLRVFLECDGAVLYYRARRLLHDHEISASGDGANTFARAMFLDLFRGFFPFSGG